MSNLLEFIVALAGLILIHETGHFIACRLFKIEVEEFGLGFPPRLVTLFERKGTKFTLNAIPLGGFVRPKGEGDPEVEGSIEAASPWARLGVYLAGPLMNLVTGILLFTVMYAFYGQAREVSKEIWVVSVVPNSPAFQAGIRACDVVQRFDGEPLDDIMQIIDLTQDKLGQEVELTLLRQGREVRVSLVPRENPPEDEGPIGIVLSYAMTMEPLPVGQAFIQGVRSTGETAQLMAALPLTWVSGKANVREDRPVGLKGMYDIYSATRTGDILSCVPVELNVLNFLASITISLAVLNLLPFPALDGGRILFVLPEIIFKKRLPPKYESLINMIGFLFLLGILLWINLQDFINPLF